MSSFADHDSEDYGWRRRRHLPSPPLTPPLVAIPLSQVRSAQDELAPPRKRKALPLIAAVAVFAHVLLGIYLSQAQDARAKIKKHLVQLEFTQPKPPEPKLQEPPKPPPKPRSETPPPPLPVATPTVSSEPVAAGEPVAAVEPPPPPPAPEPLTAPVGRAGYLNNPAPAYPAMAARMGWEGSVLLKVHVLADGHPDLVEIKQSSGHKVLDDSALNAVKQWSFTPAKRGSTPVDGWVTVPIDFAVSG
ncbi:protein TonB [Solimonas aquatica]|uniref:Protein TonB n=1 Tax=Solimonas aquatica TaxID=489703 RepID=A0A1H9DUA8_9GAMM|nr:energy transducer TonB [Solimonas aquatica]SEQ17025.1 protein TonB [Solimonas aquatica]